MSGGKEPERKEDVVLHFSSHVSAEEGTDGDWETTSAGLQMAGSPTVVSAPSAVAVGLKGDELEARKICKI